MQHTVALAYLRGKYQGTNATGAGRGDGGIEEFREASGARRAAQCGATHGEKCIALPGTYRRLQLMCPSAFSLDALPCHCPHPRHACPCPPRVQDLACVARYSIEVEGDVSRAKTEAKLREGSSGQMQWYGRCDDDGFGDAGDDLGARTA